MGNGPAYPAHCWVLVMAGDGAEPSLGSAQGKRRQGQAGAAGQSQRPWAGQAGGGKQGGEGPVCPGIALLIF